MKLKITPTEKKQVLKHNLEKRFGNVEDKENKLVIEIEEPEKLKRVPGIESFGEKEGMKGSPVDEEAYAKLEDRKDAAKAFLATVMGYDLRVLETEREWDLKNLRMYNPSIKHLKFDEPKQFLKIDKALFENDELEKVEIDLEEDEVEKVYREMIV